MDFGHMSLNILTQQNNFCTLELSCREFEILFEWILGIRKQLAK